MTEKSARRTSRSGGRDNHVYYECPECGRTVLLMYDDPEPVAVLGCTDGHPPEDMHEM